MTVLWVLTSVRVVAEAASMNLVEEESTVAFNPTRIQSTEEKHENILHVVETENCVKRDKFPYWYLKEDMYGNAC